MRAAKVIIPNSLNRRLWTSMSVFLRGLGTSDAVEACDKHETVSQLSPFLVPKIVCRFLKSSKLGKL